MSLSRRELGYPLDKLYKPYIANVIFSLNMKLGPYYPTYTVEYFDAYRRLQVREFDTALEAIKWFLCNFRQYANLSIQNNYGKDTKHIILPIYPQERDETY